VTSIGMAAELRVLKGSDYSIGMAAELRVFKGSD